MKLADGDRLVGFKRHLRPAVVPGEAAYLVWDGGISLLRGRPFEVLAPLLDGSRTLQDVVREAAPALRADTVGTALGRLGQARLLAFRRPGGPDRPDEERARAYWDLAGLDGDRAADAVSCGGVEVLAVAGADAAPVREACSGSGLRLVPGPAADGTRSINNQDPDEQGIDEEAAAPDAALTIVLTDTYLHPGLAEVDRRQRRLGRPWLLARPTGPEPWIGPFFQPGAGACWHCLADRLGEHHRPELRLSQLLGRAAPEPPAASIAAARMAAAQLTALEAAKWLAGVRRPQQDAIYSLDTLSLDGRTHPVVRRPQCPECGDPRLTARQAWRPVQPDPGPGEGPTDGEAPPTAAEILARHGSLADPVTGILGELRPEPHRPGFVHLVRSGPNLSAPCDSLGALQAVLRQHSGGKGATPDEARVSALGEAVERYSAGRRGDEAVVRGSYRDLSADAVHPDSCQLYDPRQYAGRDEWNAEQGSTHWVCEPFDETERREWTPVWSLTRERHVLVPTALLYFHHGAKGSSPQLRADSSGCAAGADLADALLRGFHELAERDAVALWWYNRTRQPGVDLDAFADPWADGLREACAAMGRTVWGLDVTSDLGVPAVVALSARSAGAPRVLLGFGAHGDPRVALRRALAELGQLTLEYAPEEFPAKEFTAPDFTAPGFTAPESKPGSAGPARPAGQPPGLARWWDGLAREGLDPYLRPAPGPALGPNDYPHAAAHRSAARSVQDAAELLRARRMELLALDLTRPDVGMPVARVLVPGLRPVWARFAPGRLFDAPVALGRLREPTAYRDLNPFPLFV